MLYQFQISSISRGEISSLIWIHCVPEPSVDPDWLASSGLLFVVIFCSKELYKILKNLSTH